MTISLILMTCMFDPVVILCGEIRCLSLLELKVLSMYCMNYLLPRDVHDGSFQNYGPKVVLLFG